MGYTWAGATDIGKVRGRNEDSVLPDGRGAGDGPVVVAVADGLGGGPAGDVASRLAIEAVASSDPDEPASEMVMAANEAIAEHVAAHIEDDPGIMTMATTLTLAVLRPGSEVDVAHVGDSRLYAFAKGRLLQATEDHTVAMDRVRAGELDPEAAQQDPSWHVISNWLGVELQRIETIGFGLGPGDRLLLCTDGLTNMVTDDAIAAVLTQEPSDERAVAALVDAANRAGGRDNTSVVVVTVTP